MFLHDNTKDNSQETTANKKVNNMQKEMKKNNEPETSIFRISPGKKMTYQC